jgi:Protein of unknown function (DUF2568)
MALVYRLLSLAMKTANLTLKFLLELAALASFAIWGAESESGALAVAHAIIPPLIVALLWGRFAAPRSRHRVPRATRIPFEMIVFALAVVALAVSGHGAWAIGLGVVMAINAALMTAFDQWDA